MGNYFDDFPVSKTAKASKPSITHDTTCYKCGWRFEHDNAAEREYAPGKFRREPRSQIGMGVHEGVARFFCTPCYEDHLWRKGKHTMQKIGEDGQLYRNGLMDQLEQIRR